MGRRIIPAIQTKNTISTLIKSGAIDGELAERGAGSWRTKGSERVSREGGRRRWGGHVALASWSGHGQYGLANAAQARAWYERSAAARDPRGMAGFGGCLLNGRWAQNTSLGWVYITDAAHLGSNVGAYDRRRVLERRNRPRTGRRGSG